MLIDTHGWLSQIITGSGKGTLYNAFLARFPDNTYASLSGGKGYFASWAGYELGYDSCLFEFPKTVNSHEDFVSQRCSQKFGDVIVSLLTTYRSAAATAEPQDDVPLLEGN